MLISDPSLLIPGVNLSIDGTDPENRTIRIFPGGVLTATGRVMWSALRSRLALHWSLIGSAMPFPVMRRSATDYAIGTDGHTFNGWTFADQETRDFLAGGSWTEYSAGGSIQAEYAHATSGVVPEAVSWYYCVPGVTGAIPIPRLGQLNSGILVYSQLAGFDIRAFQIRIRSRTRGYTYASVDFPWTSTAFVGTRIESDSLIVDSDAVIDSAQRYSGMGLRSSVLPSYREVVTPTGAQAMPFNVVVDAAGAPLSQVYQWIQRSMRRTANQNLAPGEPAWVGVTASALVESATPGIVQFKPGVFVDNLRASDWARVRLTSSDMVPCTLPWSPGSADTAELHSLLVDVSRLHGLDPDSPLTVSSSQRTAGPIVQSIAEAAGVVTVTRTS